MTPPPLWKDFDRVSRKWWLRTPPGVWDHNFLPKTFLLIIWAQKIIKNFLAVSYHRPGNFSRGGCQIDPPTPLIGLRWQ